MRENKEINKEIIVDWSKFKSNVEGSKLIRSKEGYIEFCRILNEINFELVSDYVKAVEKVELIYKFNNDIIFNTNPNNFKSCTYKAIINFKKELEKNGDGFIKFVGLSNGVLIARIKTFDNGEVDIDMARYNSWNKVRQDFYNKLKEINGYTTDCYKDIKNKINIHIDGIKLNPMSVDNFKRGTYKSIIDFKNKLIKNGDEFIKFVGVTDKGNLIARMRTVDNGKIEIDMGLIVNS